MALIIASSSCKDKRLLLETAGKYWMTTKDSPDLAPGGSFITKAVVIKDLSWHSSIRLELTLKCTAHYCFTYIKRKMNLDMKL